MVFYRRSLDDPSKSAVPPMTFVMATIIDEAIASCCVQTSQWREALRIIVECQGVQKVDTIGFLATSPMDPSSFLGSVWGIIYYNLEG